MNTSLIILAAVSYLQVFALGFQSRNVNHGNYGFALITSFFIGLSQVTVWRMIATPDGGAIETLVYSGAGAAGIVSSMYVHERFVRKKKPPVN